MKKVKGMKKDKALSPAQQEEEICKKCQECCKWLTFYLSVEFLTKFKDIYLVRGCKIHDDILYVNAPCQHLTSKGCSIYHRRPLYCRIYDGRVDPAFRTFCKLPLVSERRIVHD